VAFGHESDHLAELRQTLRSSMDVHYLHAIATRTISGKGRSFKGHTIENYTAKALLLDGSDFSNSTLSNVTFARASLNDCRFSGAALQRCVIEDLDLSNVQSLTGARMSNVTFTRVVFKGAQLQVLHACCCLCCCCSCAMMHLLLLLLLLFL
jgi:uncharacterized protein YjbI with pentapeptide repeats